MPALLLLSACASSGFQSGELKNSLPLTAKTALEEVHSIAVPPFYGDTAQWRELTHETLAAAGPRLSVIQVQKVDAAAGRMKKELLDAGPGARIEVLQKLGRQLQADAVVNGVILSKEKPEIIIQVISSRDGRVLYWQAAEFTMKEGPAAQGQRELLARALEQVKERAGTREKQAPPSTPPRAEPEPAVEQRRETEPQPKAESQQRPARQRPEKRKVPKQQLPADDDISPM